MRKNKNTKQKENPNEFDHYADPKTKTIKEGILFTSYISL